MAGSAIAGSARGVTTFASGRLLVRAQARAGLTFLADVHATAPFHVGSLHRRSSRAELIVQSVGPGIFPGDTLESIVDVGPGAELAILGQGATKIYPSPAGTPAISCTDLSVSDGGALWWLPGELIPFRSARYVGRTLVRLEHGARFALWDIVTPGRTAMGETHAYARLDLRLRLEVAGSVAVIERAVLDPVERPVDVLGSQGGFPCAGSLILFGYSLAADFGCYSADVWLGADGRDGLTVVRGLARATAPLSEVFLSILHNLT